MQVTHPRKKNMGRFSVDVHLANYVEATNAENGVLAKDQVHQLTIRGVIDSGATRLVVPDAIVKQLGLKPKRKVRVKCADGRHALRDQVDGVQLTMQGRTGVFKAVVEPKREAALVGAIVLEDLDFLVDCERQRIVPRDPKYIVSEIE